MTPFMKTPTALTVDVRGYAGSFAVSRKGEASGPVEVKYILTHVALGSGGAQQLLLDMLAPVREVFDLEQLDFDEIMQRDIDDSRVSLDLIPYLLEHRNSGLVKLFPPIVVVVLPLQELSRKPASRYRKVQRAREPEPNGVGYEWDVTTAGPLGKEQFDFRNLLRPDGTIDPGYSVLRLAPGNCALAIVDGQHRAMALLALYRNLTNGWSDARRAVYHQYYRVWDPDEIRKFELSELQMPMIVCTFPQLDESYQGNMDVIRAARRVFLDLNKNAKKVSDSRNKLLDDQDMVSQCLRTVLAKVKAYAVTSASPLRIWNVELDQAKDRSVISSPVALTGVSHLYYIAEHLLFYSERVKDVVGKRTLLARARRLDEAYTRLALVDKLTTEERNDNTRTNYTDKVAKEIEGRWYDRYGKPLELLMGLFHPFAAHCDASLRVNERLKSVNNTKLRALMFDGQASSRTFEEFKERLQLKMDAESEWSTPQLRAIKGEVDGHLAEYEQEIVRFRTERAVTFLSNVSGSGIRVLMPSKETVAEKAREAINDLYQQVFTSIAFQAALFLTFVEAYEAVYDASTGNSHALTDDNVTEYIDSIHRLFKPGSRDQFNTLISVFLGQLTEHEGSLRLAPTAWTFSQFVVGGEMKPDEWPKYRYLILEIWNSKDSGIQKIIDADVQECRISVLRLAYRRALQQHCQENGLLEQNVSEEQKQLVFANVVGNYELLLSALKRKKTVLGKVADTVRKQVGVLSTDDVDVGTSEAS